ncbi:unnamed protein product, partial [Allacma fusca]
FVNTASNAIFLLLPPVLIWLFGPYGRSYNKGIHIIWLLLIIIGLCSAYFHATLRSSSLLRRSWLVAKQTDPNPKSSAQRAESYIISEIM